MENTDKLNNYEDDEYKDAYVCFRNAGDVARLIVSFDLPLKAENAIKDALWNNEDGFFKKLYNDSYFDYSHDVTSAYFRLLDEKTRT